MNSKVMNKYFKNSPNKPEPVNEGWGTAFASIGVILGLGALIVNPIAGAGAIGAFALINGKLSSKSEQAMKKILDNPKIKKYIKDECDKAFKAVKAKHGSKFTISTDVKNNDISVDDVTTNGKRKYNDYMKNQIFNTKINGYFLEVYADTDHVDGMNVIFKLTDKSTKKWHYARHAIPSPTREDIKTMGFREE